MEECSYRMLGEVVIPESRKAELNGYVLKLLHRCGMRKTKQIPLAGKEITVLAMPEQDEQGLVWFDYSYFEKKKRKPSSYNTKTCELITPDRGYNEYGLVANMIMVLQEEYSAKTCFLTDDDKLCSIKGYVMLIDYILDIKLELTKRNQVENIIDTGVIPFYKAVRRDNEDEFMEFWNGEKYWLSDNMRFNIKQWCEEYSRIKVHKSFDMEKSMSEIITDMYDIYNCRYVDERWVAEFMDNSDNASYIKAIALLWNIINADSKRFPELTRNQVKNWITKEIKTGKETIMCSAYQSLLVNYEQRKNLFGF